MVSFFAGNSVMHAIQIYVHNEPVISEIYEHKKISEDFLQLKPSQVNWKFSPEVMMGKV